MEELSDFEENEEELPLRREKERDGSPPAADNVRWARDPTYVLAFGFWAFEGERDADFSPVACTETRPYV